MSCPLCEKDIAENALKNHIKHMHTTSNAVINCLLCNERLKESSLRQHLAIHHNQEGQKHHKCTLCDFVTLYKSNLAKHVGSIHAAEKPYKCQLCPYSSFYRGTVRNHTNNVHLKIKKKKCHLCEAAFGTACDLTR